MLERAFLARSPRLYMRTPHATARSEEHTSELQSQSNLVCRLLLEKKKTKSSNAEAGCLRVTIVPAVSSCARLSLNSVLYYLLFVVLLYVYNVLITDLFTWPHADV